MITRADIVERVGEWGLAEQVVERDYVLGWLLWGNATDSTLGQSWIFKGGTCLKKCYIEAQCCPPVRQCWPMTAMRVGSTP